MGRASAFSSGRRGTATAELDKGRTIKAVDEV